MPRIKPSEFPLQRFFRQLSAALLIAVGGGIFLGGLFLYHITQDLPDVRQLKNYRPLRATQVFSDEGTKIGEFINERRYPVDFARIPQHVVQAFLAAEDSGFYEHKGVEFLGMARALFSNLMRGKYAQGASTITQQIARGLLLSRKKEITRKIREIVLARRMEKELTKNEILGLYLNEIYLGHGAYGIGAAAQNYFRKKVEDLNLAEGALLAGLPQRPGDWDPFHGPLQAKRRQGYVLRRMADEKFITADDARIAYAQPLKLYALEELNQLAAPYVTQQIYKYLEERYGAERIYGQGFKVYTTIKYPAQKLAEATVGQGVREVDKRIGWRGPQKHLNDQAAVDAFQAETNEKILEDTSPVRILPAQPDTGMKKLQYDLSAFQSPNSPYAGQTPVKMGLFYSSVVTGIDDVGQMARARIGYTEVSLPYTSMEWVLGKDPKPARISQILKVGDVVQVKIQKIDRMIKTVEASLEQEPEVTGALLSYDLKNGFVRAMVGGSDFKKSQFNIAIQGKRQVGSVFKPVIYAAAIDQGFSPASIVTDAPIIFKYEGQLDADNFGESWRPKNYNGRFVGDIPIRLALVRSMNIPTVKILNEITLPYLIGYARQLGVSSPLQRDLSIGLGSWSSSLEEMTRVFAVFPRLGRPISLVYIKKIEDENGSVVESLDTIAHDATTATLTPGASPRPIPGETPPPPPPWAVGLPEGHVMSPQTAYVITDMLRAVVREPDGTGTRAGVVPGPIAGKTGTTSDHRDAWFIGYTPHVMTGVWVGYEKDKPLDPGESGGKAAAPIWADYMKEVAPTYPKTDFSIPEDITFAYIDPHSGRPASVHSQRRVRVAFKVGTVPNADGSNLARIGEPGSASNRGMSAETPPNGITSSETPAPRVEEETSDFMRRGYQD